MSEDDDDLPPASGDSEILDDGALAKVVAERCRAMARTVVTLRGRPDVARALVLGDLAGLCDHYGRLFDEWRRRVSVSAVRSSRERRAFMHVVQAAYAELGEAERGPQPTEPA